MHASPKLWWHVSMDFWLNSFQTCYFFIAYTLYVDVKISPTNEYADIGQTVDWLFISSLLEWFYLRICMKRGTRHTPASFCTQSFLPNVDSWGSSLCKDMGWLKWQIDKATERLAHCLSDCLPHRQPIMFLFIVSYTYCRVCLHRH